VHYKEALRVYWNSFVKVNKKPQCRNIGGNRYIFYVSGNRQDNSVGLHRLPLVNQCGLSPDLPNDF